MYIDWLGKLPSTLQHCEESKELVQCSTTRTKAVLFLLHPRFNNWPDPPLQHLGVDFRPVAVGSLQSPTGYSVGSVRHLSSPWRLPWPQVCTSGYKSCCPTSLRDLTAAASNSPINNSSVEQHPLGLDNCNTPHHQALIGWQLCTSFHPSLQHIGPKVWWDDLVDHVDPGWEKLAKNTKYIKTMHKINC